MGLYTRITRDWLEQRFRRRSADGVYFAHMPIYGVGHPDCEPGHAGRLARVFRILRALDGIRCATLLDVGGAEGWLPHLARELFGIRSASCDLAVAACARARELFSLPSAALDCARLPFADDAFDVVVCSEVIEHVEHPVITMLELQRVARCAVILTTEELHHDRAHIDDYLFRRPGWPHMERNLFHPDDLALCLPGAVLTPQCDRKPPRECDPAAVRAFVLANTKTTELRPGRTGVVAVAPRAAFAARERTCGDEELLDRLLGTMIAPGTAKPPTPPDPWLLALLRDPLDHLPLRLEGPMLHGARASYPILDGVPDLLPVDAPEPTRADLERRTAGLPPARAQGLLSLHDRLFLPERWNQDAFDFDRREDRRGFWCNEQLQPRPGAAGFRWFSTGADPWLLTPCLQRPVRAVELDLRVHAPAVAVAAGHGQVFWKGPDDQTFGEDRSVKFAVPNDGRMHTHRIELARHPRLPAVVQWLRIDPIDGPCEVDLLGLRLA